MFQAYDKQSFQAKLHIVRRGRGKFAILICLWHRSTTRKPHNLSKRAYCRTESSRI